MAPKYRCKHCGHEATHAAMARHIALAHKADEQPRCKCGEVASVWATRSRKTAYCRRHANRYGICRWCGSPLDMGFGQGGGRCQCVAAGVIPQGMAA